MNRRSTIGAVAAAFLLCSSSLLMALPGKVVLKDGKSFEGDVTVRKDANRVDVVVDGKKYSFSMAIVEDIQLDENAPRPTPGQPQPGQPQPGQPQPGQPQPGQPQPPGQSGVKPGMTVEQEFEARMQALGPREVAGRIKLAQWAVERKRYDMAHAALDQALRIDPRNREAQDFMKVVEAQQRLNQRQGNRPPQQGGPTTPSQPGAPRGDQPPMQEGDGERPGQPRTARGQGGDRPAGLRPLTPDEINRVRMLEWRPDDRGVNVRLLNNVKRRFLARARDVKPADFNAMTATEQAQLIIREQGTEDMLADIRIVNDPPSLQEYRTGIQRPMLQTCAAQQCHGGGEGSERFALFHRADKEPEAYANFLALNNYVGKAGGGGGQPKDEKQKQQKQKQEGSVLSSNEPREARMIDRNRPEDSLLIQYGLPYDVADAPHPEVPGFKPLFRTRNDARYRQFVRWVADALAPIDQDYGIDMSAAPEEQAGARQVGREGPQGTDPEPTDGEGADEPDDAPPARAPAGRQPARGAQGQR